MGKAYLGVWRTSLYNYLTAFRSELPVLIYEKEMKPSKKWLSSVAQVAKSETGSLIQSSENVWHIMS